MKKRFYAWVEENEYGIWTAYMVIISTAAVALVIMEVVGGEK